MWRCEHEQRRLWWATDIQTVAVHLLRRLHTSTHGGPDDPDGVPDSPLTVVLMTLMVFQTVAVHLLRRFRTSPHGRLVDSGSVPVQSSTSTISLHDRCRWWRSTSNSEDPTGRGVRRPPALVCQTPSPLHAHHDADRSLTGNGRCATRTRHNRKGSLLGCVSGSRHTRGFVLVLPRAGRFTIFRIDQNTFVLTHCDSTPESRWGYWKH